MPARPCEAGTMERNPVNTIINSIKVFAADDTGATAIEYALIAAGIAVAIVTAVNSLGTTISGKFDEIKGKLGGS